MASKDDEIRDVTRRLDDLMNDLRDSVAALSGLLHEPPPPPGPGEVGERLVTPT